MKKLLSIVATVLFIASNALAVPVTVVEGPAELFGGGGGGDASTLNGEPGAFYLNYSSHSGNIKKDDVPNWDRIVCQVTECNGIHTHEAGESACQISFKSISTVQMAGGCTVHLNGGIEYNFDAGTFSNINPDFVNSSVWIGIDSSGIVQQTGEFTNAQRLSIAPLARVQSEGSDSQIIATIMDVRFKSTAFEWRFQNWVRDFVGALAGSGLETTEVGTRNLSLSSGTFSDTEIDGHTTVAFSHITGLLVHSTAFSPVTTIEGLFQADNLQYDTGSGLATMTNNNWYASHNLAMSTAGGIVNGVDTGRGPTFLLIMSNGQWNSLGEALEQPFYLGAFAGSKDIIRLAKLVVQKNSDGITEIVQVQPFNTSGTGTGVAGTSSLQQVYNNSPNSGTPELTTNPTNNDLTIRYGGNNGKIQSWQKSDGTEVFAVLTSSQFISYEYVYVRDEKAAGVDGGTFTLGAYRTRTLNTVVSDTFNNVSSLSSNQLTLHPGTYIYHVKAQAFKVSPHWLRLYNVTAAASIETGSEASSDGGDNTITHAFIDGKFAIVAGQKLEIQHFGTATQATNGFGRGNAIEPGRFAEIQLWKEVIH